MEEIEPPPKKRKCVEIEDIQTTVSCGAASKEKEEAPKKRKCVEIQDIQTTASTVSHRCGAASKEKEEDFQMTKVDISIPHGFVEKKNNLMTTDSVLLESLMQFYTMDDNLEKMVSVLLDKKLSLRIIDWFVCNYAKHYCTVYEFVGRERGDLCPLENLRFKVYNSYKLHLDSYQKYRFDPFCRNERVIIPYDENHNLETTIAQLIYFRWVLENHVIDYVTENYDAIKEDLEKRGKKDGSRKKLPSDPTNKTRKKREELSSSGYNYIIKDYVKTVNQFNV